VAIFRKDSQTGRAWLEFDGKPDVDTIAALKRDGWRWSGFRKQWHNNRRFVKPPASVQFEDGGMVDYSAERSERLAASAEKAGERAATARASAQRIMDVIPMGQPILVGHHSERRARSDISKIDRSMQRSFEEHKKAEYLARKAESSERHQARLHSAGVISRRLDKLRAIVRKLEREGRTDEEIFAHYRAQVVANEAELAEVAPHIAAQPKAGDLIKIHGLTVRVSRVNPKTISGTVEGGGANGRTGKWDKSHFQGILESS